MSKVIRIPVPLWTRLAAIVGVPRETMTAEQAREAIWRLLALKEGK